MHTLSIVRLCERAAEIYPFIDKDLLIAGAILHDIAKTSEYEMSQSGLATGYTVKGNLIGHLAVGAMMIENTAKNQPELWYGVNFEGVLPKLHDLLEE